MWAVWPNQRPSQRTQVTGSRPCWGAGEGGVGGEAEEGARAELDGSGEVIAGGDEDFAAAEDGAAVDRALDVGCVFGGAVASGSVVADVEAQVGGFGWGLGVGFGLGGVVG
jgi:hypothetical protein